MYIGCSEATSVCKHVVVHQPEYVRGLSCISLSMYEVCNGAA
jgi:hypothetical protein